MKRLIIAFMIIVCSTCSQPENESILNEFQEIKNLSVYSADTKSTHIIFLIKDTVYRESDEIIIGKLGEIAVDRLGLVFIADTHKQVINVFEPDGKLINQIGREGRGPGEFSSIKSLIVRENRLYVHDFHQNRVNVFSLDSLQEEKTILLAKSRRDYSALVGAYSLTSEFIVGNRNTYFAKFLTNRTTNNSKRVIWQNIEIKGLLYLLDHNGGISRKLLEFTDTVYTIIPYNNLPAMEFPLTPFYGKAFTLLSSENIIYFIEPDHFLVKIYSPSGAYLHAFHYPLEKIPLTRASAINIGVSELGTSNPELFINNMDSIVLPEFWPVLTDMKIDDEDRLWIATTVEDMSFYEWWILQKDGELITRFEWPRDVPIEVIINGYIYTRETEKETGLQQIVRYRIEFEEV